VTSRFSAVQDRKSLPSLHVHDVICGFKENLGAKKKEEGGAMPSLGSSAFF
jgi:hypothetical protein